MALFSKKTENKKQQDAPASEVVNEVNVPETSVIKAATNFSFSVTRPRISEKSAQLSKMGKYVFLVQNKANKPEIKKAVEKVYKVHVTQVNIIKNKSKNIKFGRTEGTRSGFKKAIITLRKGESLESAENK